MVNATNPHEYWVYKGSNQWGLVKYTYTKQWQEFSLNLEFPTWAILHSVSNLSNNGIGGYTIAITGAANGDYDMRFFRVSSTTPNIYMSWLIFGH